ncbi:10343_t:CDS:2 [Entrophospora sp. SA101]|nr:10343_t:CDS:2 [Entrophospora sp. SA101]
MRLLQIINKLWSKITETKWAILYVRFAAVRLVVAIAMNAVILKLHEDIAEKLLNLHDIENDLPDDRKYAYINYDYEIYRIITVGMINLMLILFSGINLARSLKWIGRINNQLEIDRPFIDDDTVDTTDISRAVITWEIIHLLILTGFAASSLFFGYKFENVEGNTRTIILQCIMVAIVIPTIGLALWGVIMISNLIFILASVIIKREEDILGILLIVLSMIVAYLTARNFGFGLEDHFQKKHQIVTVDLESSGVQQPTRFSIDG